MKLFSGHREGIGHRIEGLPRSEKEQEIDTEGLKAAIP
jgi:hypothetical protein